MVDSRSMSKKKRRRFEYMDIYAPKGAKVILWKLENGYPYNRDAFKKHGMKKYSEYTVDHTRVSSCSTALALVEFPGTSFNTVNFGVEIK